MTDRKSWDVAVIGAGHAGCEAALAAARLGARVVVVTMRADRVAQMSCNPAIGGVGKGHLVREIDALGGAMGRVADATGIQYRRLNQSRGAAVRSTRCQADSDRYREVMTEVLAGQDGLTLMEGEVVDFLRNGERLVGIRLRRGGELRAATVIVTTGTFLNGLCHIGDERFKGGRIDDAPASRLSDALRSLNVELGRFKTGTTPRLAADSIRWDALDQQSGDEPRPTFSFDRVANSLPQVHCALTATNPRTHACVQEALPRSPLYQGIIEGLGPRYCPSLEDKVVRFPDRDRHGIFLEPEGLESDRVYPNGLSTSLPRDSQLAFLRTIHGLERCEVLQYGYAVEYDYAPPTQLTPDLMYKRCAGLFFAGQINGTSGYEEAAAQGLLAGLHAVQWLNGDPCWRPRRDQAYLGVMVDDLVTQGVDEPYRIFTSRAEHRLMLREGNAEERLFSLASRLGLLTDKRIRGARARQAERERLRALCRARRLGREDLHAIAVQDQHAGTDSCTGVGVEDAGSTIEDVVRRPRVGLWGILDGVGLGRDFSSACVQAVEEEIRYRGYIEREAREVERCRELEAVSLPRELSFRDTPGLSLEVQEKLERVRPESLAQASRIPGMTPAALAILRVMSHRPAGNRQTRQTSSTRG